MDKKILFLNGKTVDPVSKTESLQDVLVDNGKIIDLGHLKNIDTTNMDVIDCLHMTIAPGLMDPHVHFRDPGFTWKEDIHTGSLAAAAGGFTDVVCMANTNPVPDRIEILDDLISREKMENIHIRQTVPVTEGMRGEKLADMKLLAEHGAAGFTDDGKPIMHEELVHEAMKMAALLNKPISLHEEDPMFVHAAGVHRGKVSSILGYAGAMREAEEILTARDCVLALATGASVSIQHISSGRSVEIVRLAKKLGADIHAEATPHHFTLTDEAVLKYGTNAKMNPPLRTEEDRMMIIEGLKDGTIDMIATDHAPHSIEEKSQPLSKAPSGIIGLETSLALGIHSLVDPGYLTMSELIHCMSTAPANFYRIPASKIEIGAAADFIVFNEKENHIIDRYHSKSSNSPFTGWTLPGKIHYTVCDGRFVYEQI